MNDYALKNKKEIRRAEFRIAKYKDIAKQLNRTTETKESDEAKHFLAKLKNMGFLPQEASALDEVLDMRVRDILERRLSNVIYKHKMAKSPQQARQFVVHGHIKVGETLVSSPSYLVPVADEVKVTFSDRSSLSDENHPERKMESEGVKKTFEELEETPWQQGEEESFDEKEAELDDEEQDEALTEDKE